MIGWFCYCVSVITQANSEIKEKTTVNMMVSIQLDINRVMDFSRDKKDLAALQTDNDNKVEVHQQTMNVV